MLMTGIAAGWTAATNLLVRIVERSIHTVCLLLVGALIGAWIVHLNETPEIQAKGDQIIELGKRLNLCLAEKEDEHKLVVELLYEKIQAIPKPTNNP